MKKLAILSLFVSSATFAVWKPKLIARADIQGNGFNMPAFSTTANASPQINNEGDVVLKMSSVEGKATPAIWLYRAKDSSGKVVFKGAEGEYLGDPSFNMDAMTVFHHFTEYESFGIKLYDPPIEETSTVISPKERPGTMFFLSPQINDVGQVLFLGLKEDYTREIVLVHSQGTQLIAKEDNEISYLFKPSFNNLGQVAVKARLGDSLDESSPDQIRYYDNFGGMSVRNEDQDSSTNSKYTGFQNGVSLSNSNYLAYVAYHQDGKAEVLLNQRSSTLTIAREGEGDIKTIESFTPQSNNYKEVIFRAINKEGKRSVYVYTNRKLVKLISEGDEVPCDLEEACYVTFKSGFPGIAGNPALNDLGEAAIHLDLSNKNMDKYFGSGIYKFSQIHK